MKRQKKMEKAKGSLVKTSEEKSAKKIEKPSQEKQLLTSTYDNQKIETGDRTVDYKQIIEDYRAFFENNDMADESDEAIEKLAENMEEDMETMKSLQNFETNEKKEETDAEILLAMQRGAEVERISWLKMTLSGEKEVKTADFVQEKIWQMSPSGGSGLRFSLKAVKSDVETNLTCNGCGHIYTHRSQLKRHMKRSMCAAEPQCSCKCGKIFKVRDSLRRHVKNGCNLEEKVELHPQEHIDLFSILLEKYETAKDKVEELKEDDRNSSREDEKDVMDIDMELSDEKSVKEEEGKYVTLLREQGVEQILSRYSALLVQKLPKEEEKRIPVESESGKTKRVPMKTLAQSKHRSQQPAITVDQVSTSFYLDTCVQILFPF